MKQSSLPQDPRRRRTISRLLEDFLAEMDRETFTLAELLALLGPRAYGLSILIFALANLVLGALPGASAILTIPIMLLALQMLFGLSRPWMPKRMQNIRFKRTDFQTMVHKVKPYLTRVECLCRPRLLLLTGKYGKNLVGLACLAIGFVLMLPIVFGNFLPSLALVMIAIGLVERDGAFILLGTLLGALATLYAILFYGSIMQAILHVVPHVAP